ncbi:MAG TPA: transcription elongation factor GreA [Candidatus Deferrimicrobiaceae bacterium]|nr:transcription elongation factor GreA [Candidatus Deferrimicrobiaceae bacterium]
MDFLRESRQRLTDEAKRIEYELRVVLPKEIQAALAHGDLSENGEYEAAKERQFTLNARLSQIQKRLADLSRIDIAGIPKDRAGLGSQVTVEDAETGREIRFTLVIPEIADGQKNFVSIASPVGRALLNRRPGDTVTVQAPKGSLEYEVTGVVTVFGDPLP